MPTFCDLPHELSDIVCEQYIPDIVDKQETEHFITAFTGLLMCNKQIGSEGAQVATAFLHSRAQALGSKTRPLRHRVDFCEMLYRKTWWLDGLLVLQGTLALEHFELIRAELEEQRLETSALEVRRLRYILFGETDA